MEDLKTLKGEVDSIIFKSEDTGFCVLMLNCDNDLITVVGEMGDVEEGEDLVVTGEFTSHQKFGEQFKVHIFERSLPTTSSALSCKRCYIRRRACTCKKACEQVRGRYP